MSYRKILEECDIFVITDASIVKREVRGGISIFYKKDDDVHMLCNSFYLGYGSVSTNAEMKAMNRALQLLTKMVKEEILLPEGCRIDFSKDLNMLVMNDNASAINVFKDDQKFVAKSLYAEKRNGLKNTDDLRSVLDHELTITYVHAPREYNVISDKLSNYKDEKLFHKIIDKGETNEDRSNNRGIDEPYCEEDENASDTGHRS